MPKKIEKAFGREKKKSKWEDKGNRKVKNTQVQDKERLRRRGAEQDVRGAPATTQKLVPAPVPRFPRWPWPVGLQEKRDLWWGLGDLTAMAWALYHFKQARVCCSNPSSSK